MTPWHTYRPGTRLAAVGLLGTLLGLGLAPAARAADVVVSSSYPTVIFHNTFFTKSKWLLQGPGLSSGSSYLYDSETWSAGWSPIGREPRSLSGSSARRAPGNGSAVID
jgi:hypothetical protein